MFSHALSYYKYTQVNTILYDLRCNAGGSRSVTVWIRHEAESGAPRLTVHALNNMNNMVNIR